MCCLNLVFLHIGIIFLKFIGFFIGVRAIPPVVQNFILERITVFLCKLCMRIGNFAQVFLVFQSVLEKLHQRLDWLLSQIEIGIISHYGKR